jgi:hypothetical protein
VVHLSEEKCASASGTLSRRRARCIEQTVGKIRVAVTIAKDAIAIPPLALVERLRCIRGDFLEHDPPHWTMVEITQREEVDLRMMVHGSSLEGVPIGRSRLSEKPGLDPPETKPRSMSCPGIFRRPERPGKICRVEFHSFSDQLPRRLGKGCPFRQELALGSLAIGRRVELAILLQIGEFTIVEIDFLMERSEEVFVVWH